MGKKDFSSFSFVFIGETHGFINDFDKEKEVIEAVKPEFVLSEQMQDLKLDSEEKKLEILRKKRISETVRFNEVKSLIELCHEKKIKLIGIDFRDFGFDERLKAVAKGQKKATREDEMKFEALAKKREARHLEMIKKFKEKTERPIIVLTGTWHLREDSLLMNSLTNYIVIYPCAKEGELLIEPPNSKAKIKYCTKVKDGKKGKD